MALSGLDYKLIDVVVHFKESLPTKPIAPSLPSSHILSSGVCKINEYGETEAVKYKQGQKHFTPEEIAHIVAEYQLGKSTYKLAELYGCKRITISNVLKRNGVNVSNNTGQKKLDVSDVVNMYENMHTSSEIAGKYAVSPDVVIRCLRAQSVKIRGRWG